MALGRNTVPFNVTGWPPPFPCPPVSTAGCGLPVGLQLVVRPWDEAELLDLAYGFEQAMAGK